MKEFAGYLLFSVTNVIRCLQDNVNYKHHKHAIYKLSSQVIPQLPIYQRPLCCTSGKEWSYLFASLAELQADWADWRAWAAVWLALYVEWASLGWGGWSGECFCALEAYSLAILRWSWVRFLWWAWLWAAIGLPFCWWISPWTLAAAWWRSAASLCVCAWTAFLLLS